MTRSRFDVIWVAPSLANLGGTEYAVVTLARLFVAGGHRLRLLTGPDAHPAWRERLDLDGLALIEEHDGSPEPLCTKAQALHDESAADLVQFMPIEDHCLAWLRRGGALPVVGWEPTDLSPQCWWLPGALNELIHKLDALLVLNPTAERHAKTRYGYQGIVRVVPNSLMTLPAVRTTRSSGKALVVGCISRLSAEKGLEYLFAAFALLLEKCPDAELALWGEGEDKARLKILATMLGIEPSVQFRGAFDPFTEIDEVAAAADVFVLSSLFEGAPIALLELAARGRPMVASMTAGACWVCGEDYQWLTPIGDTRAMAAALAEALTGSSGDQASAHLLQRVGQMFTADKTLAALCSAYVDAVQ